MVAVVLALLSSLCWGSADFGGGLAARRVPVGAVVLFSQAAGAVVLLVVCLVAGQPFPHLFAAAMAAGLFGVVGLLLFYRGLAIGKMSLVAPVAACGALIPVLFSVATGQAPRPLTLAGLASAMVGIVLASISSSDGLPQGGRTPGHPRAAAMMAIGAALCFGVFLLLLGRAAHLEPQSVLWLSLCTRLTSVPAVAVGIAASRSTPPWRGLTPGLLGTLALVGIGDAAANTLFAVANTLGALAVVAVLGSLYPLVTALLARFQLGELLSTRQKAGAGFAVLGVILVSIT
jgi:drug/metabolite transporter (DMT)-like permease